MDIVFSFQGEVVYSISLPNDTVSVSFDLGSEPEVYHDIKIGIPFIKNILFKNCNNKLED